MRQKYLMLAGVLGALAVIVGAFGAHQLKDQLDEETLAAYNTGVEYHFYHVMALLAICLAPASLWNQKSTVWAARLLVVGMFFFSGSLYVLAISGIKWLGAITPFGGVAWIAAWVCVALSAKGLSTPER
jgi:uncharacterized membrane protein YgdD (TMEM256/DUF423 family)